MPDPAYNVVHSMTRKERAEAAALSQAQADYTRTPAHNDIEKLDLRLLKVEGYIGALRGEEGIDNEGPIFRLSRRPIPIAPEAFTGVTLTFCGPDDVEHTGDFHVKNVAPPL